MAHTSFEGLPVSGQGIPERMVLASLTARSVSASPRPEGNSCMQFIVVDAEALDGSTSISILRNPFSP